jgi:hypothetical protein
LDAKLVGISSVEKAGVPVKDAYCDDRPDTTEAMDLRDVKWVVDFVPLDDFLSLGIKEASEYANECSCPEFNVVTTCSDTNHARKNSVAEVMHIVGVLDLPLLNQSFIDKDICILIVYCYE